MSGGGNGKQSNRWGISFISAVPNEHVSRLGLKLGQRQGGGSYLARVPNFLYFKLCGSTDEVFLLEPP